MQNTTTTYGFCVTGLYFPRLLQIWLGSPKVIQERTSRD